MHIKDNNKSKKCIKLSVSKDNFSSKLIDEVKEAYKDYRNGDYFKGSADEVIGKLKDETHKIKKI